jgi:ATP-dependent helicase IRC3
MVSGSIGAESQRKGRKMLALRPYQEEALDAIRNSASKRQLVVLPTGTGKTVTFAELADQRKNKGRILILVHRDELVRQTRAKCSEAGLQNVGTIQGEQNAVGAKIAVASVQSLSRPARMMEYLAFGQCETLIIDEAHHSIAPTYLAIINNCLSETGLLVGFTATPDRKDAGAGRWHTGPKSLGGVFDYLAYYRPIDEMIAEGWLADILPATCYANLKLTKKNGDWSDVEIDRAFTPETTQDIVTAWQNAMVNHGNRPTIVFVPTVHTAELMLWEFVDNDIPAAMVSGKTPHEERQQTYADLRSGKIKVLVNCMVLTEGFDEPCIGCVIVARPTKSRGLFTQMVGRGLRLFPGKKECIILSVVDHNLNLNPVKLQNILDDVGWKDGQLLSERKKEVAEKLDADEEEKEAAFAFIQKFRKRSGAKFAWANHMGMWRLNVPTFGIITLTEDGFAEDETKLWQIVWPNGDLGEPQRIDGAVAEAESRAKELTGGIVLDPEASWNKRPVTDNQVKLAQKLGIDPVGMNRGELSRAINEKQTEPPTDKQLRYARYLGWSGDARTATKRELMVWIGRAKKGEPR